MKQAIGNFCGNMAFIRAAADDQDKLEFEDGSILKQRHCALKTEQSALKNEVIQEAHDTMAREGLPQYNKGHI